MDAVTDFRRCSRPGCGAPAIATLRYDYAARMATINQLERGDDPHSWDLCERHLSRQTVPEGWGLDWEEGVGTVTETNPAHPDQAAMPGVPGIADSSYLAEDDFTDEEMQALAAALESPSIRDGDDDAPLTSAPLHPVSRVVRRADIPQPSGHHPSRRNLPGRAPQRHLRAVQDTGER